MGTLGRIIMKFSYMMTGFRFTHKKMGGLLRFVAAEAKSVSLYK